MKIRTIGAAGVLALALAACGGSDDEPASPADATAGEVESAASEADTAAAKAIADSIMDSNDETFEVTQKQADCVGDGMVEDIGSDQLVEYGIITEDYQASNGIESVKMSEDDAQAAADTMQECADIKEIFTGAMGELPEEAQTCIDDKLTDEVLNEFLVSVFKDDQAAGQQGLMTALTECMTAGG